MIVSTPDLAVAKAALTAALLRDDPTPVPRGAIEDGIDLIDRTLDKCSHENVQVCYYARELPSLPYLNTLLETC